MPLNCHADVRADARGPHGREEQAERAAAAERLVRVARRRAAGALRLAAGEGGEGGAAEAAPVGLAGLGKVKIALLQRELCQEMNFSDPARPIS